MAAIDDMVGAWTLPKTKDEVPAALTAARVPCAPVKTARDVAYDPHLEARGFWVDVDHPRRGKTRVPISAIRLHTGGKSEIRRAAPTLGQDTDAVLGELLGLKPAELDKLRADEVTVGAADGAGGLTPIFGTAVTVLQWLPLRSGTSSSAYPRASHGCVSKLGSNFMRQRGSSNHDHAIQQDTATHVRHELGAISIGLHRASAALEVWRHRLCE